MKKRISLEKTTTPAPYTREERRTMSPDLLQPGSDEFKEYVKKQEMEEE